MIESSAPGLELPRGVSFWTSEEMVRENASGMPWPTWTTGEVATIFYARTRRWLYDKLTLPEVAGIDVGYLQRVTDPHLRTLGRRWTLHNIERLTHGLLDGHHVDGRRASAAITIVKAQAILHGFHAEIERKERARG